MSARLAAAPRSVLAGVLAFLLVAAGVLGVQGTARADSAPPDPTDPTNPTTVTAEPLPTVQIDGVVWAQAIVGNTVYAAGKFTNARPAGAAPGTQLTPRNNLLAYDIRTGQLITSFAPNLNGQVMAVAASPDGSRIYVGGDFTQADGQPRSRVAAYSTSTGQLISTFRPAVNGTVRGIAASASTVYLGGQFTAIGSSARAKLAAVSATDGALLPWAPKPGIGSTAGNRLPNNPAGNAKTSNDVLALVLAGDNGQVVAAGRFDTLNGVKATGVGALDGVTGATRAFAANKYITNQGANSAVWSLSTDGTTVYGTAYDYYGPGDLEGSFAATANGGTVRWFADCRGDTYSAFGVSGVVYTASHAHDCRNIDSFPEQSPVVRMFGNAFSAAGAGVNKYINQWNGARLAGQPAPAHLAWAPTFQPGTFTGQGQAGWTVTGNATYVAYGGEFPAINGFKQQGLVRFAVPASKDAPKKLGPKSSTTWTPTATMIRGAVRVAWKAVADRDNENLTYRVYRDSLTSTPVCETTQASLWWRLPTYACADTSAPAGSHRWLVTATDPFGNTLTSTASTAATVPAGSAGKDRAYAQAVARDGAIDHWWLGEPSGTTGYDYAGTRELTTYSGVTRGAAGAVNGDVDKASTFNGTSTGYAVTRTAVPGPQTFSVEAWFQTTTKLGGRIVGFGNGTTALSTDYDRHVYMDTAGRVSFGVFPGAMRTLTTAAAYNDGTWHHVVGTLSSRGMALYVDGALAGSRSDTTSARVYNGYWRIGGDKTWSGAQFLNGRIDEVAVYPAALGAADVAEHFALATTGQAPNTPPAAAFTAQAKDLALTVDGSMSGDPDGTIASYAWNFGDGGTATGTTASHSYPRAGTYPVRLTVTDDRGATATTTQNVTVTSPPTGAGSIAADSFGRTVTGGWGAADTGGAWTIGGVASDADVNDGSGSLTAQVGRSTSALLAGVDRADVALQVAVTLPKAPTGGGTYVSLATRHVGNSDYRVKLVYGATGSVKASLTRLVDNVETTLGTYTVATSLAAGSSLTVRFETSGTGTTTLNVKAWVTGTAEPAGWGLTRTDSTSTLQRSGALYIWAYASGSATAPSTVRVDDLTAEPTAP
jgi:PKD repeat protein